MDAAETQKIISDNGNKNEINKATIGDGDLNKESADAIKAAGPRRGSKTSGNRTNIQKLRKV